MMERITPALETNFAIPSTSYCTHPLAEFPLEVDCDPIFERQRPMPIKFKAASEKTMREWKETARIEKAPRNAPWNVPVHCVLKKDEQGRFETDENGDPVEVRPCFDFRTINSRTKEFFSPMPHINAIFALMACSCKCH